MKIQDLADRVAAEHQVGKAEAKRIVTTVLDAITSAAREGQEVSLPGFGKFKVQHRPERQARNPRTGETVTVAAMRKLVYQPAKVVKDALNGVAVATSHAVGGAGKAGASKPAGQAGAGARSKRASRSM
jgi:DNA-binding protein HU-beta